MVAGTAGGSPQLGVIICRFSGPERINGRLIRCSTFSFSLIEVEKGWVVAGTAGGSPQLGVSSGDSLVQRE